MKVTCLLVLLCVAVVYEAEAGWWNQATTVVGKAAETVVRFLGKKERRRRELSDGMDADSVNQVQKICKRGHMDELTVDGLPFEMVKVTFEKVQQKHGNIDVLDMGELKLFIDALDVYKFCMEEKEKSG